MVRHLRAFIVSWAVFLKQKLMFALSVMLGRMLKSTYRASREQYKSRSSTESDDLKGENSYSLTVYSYWPIFLDFFFKILVCFVLKQMHKSHFYYCKYNLCGSPVWITFLCLFSGAAGRTFWLGCQFKRLCSNK